MNHYTYKLTFTDGRKYIGVRSSKCLPEEDFKYLGSSKHIKDLEVLDKEIISTFKSRKEAVQHEIYLHDIYDVARSDEYLNKAKQTTTGFDTSGMKLHRSAEHNEKIRKSLTGRIRSESERLAISKAKLGKSNGPHSEETKLKLSKARLGVEGYKKGETFDPQHHTKAYSSRVKYPDKYYWVHDDGSTMYETCMRMGQLFPHGSKPTAGFRRVVQGTKKWLGWRLDTQPN